VVACLLNKFITWSFLATIKLIYKNSLREKKNREKSYSSCIDNNQWNLKMGQTTVKERCLREEERYF
jgi:hypothetical protein